MDRRELIRGTAALAAGSAMLAGTEAQGSAAKQKAGAAPANGYRPKGGARCRVLIVNDLSGDPDGAYATAHALLSPSAQVVGLIGTATPSPGETAPSSVELAHGLLEVMGMAGKVPVYQGATTRLSDTSTPIRSAGAQAIIDEAMRSDAALPLYVTVGAGLTEVASALMMESRIADRFTLLWVGGGIGPSGFKGEFNFGIDPLAVQVVFNDYSVPLWQVPREAYAACVVSNSELMLHIERCGTAGTWLFERMEAVSSLLGKYGRNTGETWTLGDSPMVLLTALTDWGGSGGRQPRYERSGGSHYDEIYAPRVNQNGTCEARTEGRKIRVYTSLDTRLMVGDFFAKMAIAFGR